ncbi:MAG: hypothetical protein KDK63_02355 [Chlamydiia bacterium]|nr:hypothetical protein [Chlamydiia bacterium]MCB1115662.1 hypothetical protein [Chlamydiia bacterium]
MDSVNWQHYVGIVGIKLSLDAGCSALVSRGLNRTVSYIPALAAGAFSFPPFFFQIDHAKCIRDKLGEKNKNRLLLATLVLGGAFAKLCCPHISKTHALALSLLNVISSHLAFSAIFPRYLYDTN